MPKIYCEMTEDQLVLAIEHVREALRVGEIQLVTRLDLRVDLNEMEMELHARKFRRPARVAARISGGAA